MNRFDSTGHPLFLPSLAYIDADGALVEEIAYVVMQHGTPVARSET